MPDSCQELTIKIYFYLKGYQFAPPELIKVWMKRQKNHLKKCKKCRLINARLNSYYTNFLN